MKTQISPDILKQAQLTREGRWLVARFPGPQITLSWAVVKGGFQSAQTVAWYQVQPEDLEPSVDPLNFLQNKLEEARLSEAVGLLTSGDLDRYVDLSRHCGEDWVRCVATVGMSNALCVGDLPSHQEQYGTINILCQVSFPLSKEAMIEAVSIASEARTAAVLESRIPSIQSGEWATGTGTDCVVIAAPESKKPLAYAGKHTAVGHLIGATVLEAVRLGIGSWRKR